MSTELAAAITSAGRHQIDQAQSAPLMRNFNLSRGPGFYNRVHYKTSSNLLVGSDFFSQNPNSYEFIIDQCRCRVQQPQNK
jgi:hypothetical protein